MVTRVGRSPRVNPFSTRFTAPGTIPFLMPAGVSLADLVGRLAANGRGEIVGPHGSGKSSLLAALLPLLDRWDVRHVRLTVVCRELPPQIAAGLPAVLKASPPASRRLLETQGRPPLLVIDGFEQLGWLTRRRLKRHAAGLLVTSHRPTGLPALHCTDVTAPTAATVLRGLLPPGGDWVLKGYDVPARLRANRGSLRDVLFELYDRWERGSEV